MRVFEYGYAEGLRTQIISDDVITIEFSNDKIIYLETAKTPDKVTLRLEFPDGNSYDYFVDMVKFLNYSISDIGEKKMGYFYLSISLNYEKTSRLANPLIYSESWHQILSP